jgi:cellulose synthase/poly-beta-1,6-N-acetylglucosamine synthase-like glycosyltransferase
LLLYSLCSFNLAYLFQKYSKENALEPLTELPNPLPFVTVQLPIFNEKYVVERLVKKIAEFDYPAELFDIQLLDDSTDETTEICKTLVKQLQAQGLQISHIHRTNRDGFKAGALRDSLSSAKGEFIAIFDADFLPEADFIKKTLPYFENSKIGMVQTRWQHINDDFSALTRAQALALDGHFVVEQTARNKHGHFINFNGTAGVWRKETIIDAGNWQSDTITEDLDLSFRAQLKGWKFHYLTDYTTAAELPAEINALKSQQYRWTKGAIETAKKLLPAVWRSDLSFSNKLQCTYHLTSNLVYLAVLGVAILNLPLIYIKTNLPEFSLYFVFMSIFSLSFIGPAALYYTSQKATYTDWKKRLKSFPIYMSGTMGLTLNNAKAVFDGLIGKKTAFVRTPKFNINTKADKFHTKKYKMAIKPIVFIELFMVFYTFSSLAIAVYYAELAAIPFHFMFFFGFATVSTLTFKHHFAYQ